MGLFGKKKPNSFLGVDIGGSSIKIVEFGNTQGRATLLTYGYAELPDVPGQSTLDNPTLTGETLARVCQEAGVKTTQAMVALPTSHVFSTVLSIPFIKDQKTRQALVSAEVGKLAPLPLSEMIIQTSFLDEDADEQKNKQQKTQTQSAQTALRAFVTGSAKTLIQTYIEICKIAKLHLQAIDTEALALVRSLIGKDKGAICLLDIGFSRSNIIIVEKGIPFVSRSIAIGGKTVIAHLIRTMNVSAEEAASILRDLSANTSQSFDQKIETPSFIEAIMQPLVNEMRYAFQLYASMELAEIKKVEKIIVTGGSAHLPRIPQLLSRALNLNVYRGDPWARVVYPSDLSSVLEEIGPRMSVAVGLAMRETH